MTNYYFGNQEDDTKLGLQAVHAAEDQGMDPMGLSADDDDPGDEDDYDDEEEEEEEEDGDDQDDDE